MPLKKLFRRTNKIKEVQEGIFKVKSIMIGRKKKVMGNHPCFISLFSINQPHLDTNGPDKMFDYEDISHVHIHGLISHYLPTGNDIVIDNLNSVEIRKKGNSLYVSGRHIKK